MTPVPRTVLALILSIGFVGETGCRPEEHAGGGHGSVDPAYIPDPIPSGSPELFRCESDGPGHGEGDDDDDGHHHDYDDDDDGMSGGSTGGGSTGNLTGGGPTGGGPIGTLVDDDYDALLKRDSMGGGYSPHPRPSKKPRHNHEDCRNRNLKVLVCHVPPGNPGNPHTICVSLHGAVHGHGVKFDGRLGGHGGDYPGFCQSGPGPTTTTTSTTSTTTSTSSPSSTTTSTSTSSTSTSSSTTSTTTTSTTTTTTIDGGEGPPG